MKPYQDRGTHTQTASQASKCPVCGGSGWEVYQSEPEIYKDMAYKKANYARKCSACNGGMVQQAAAVKTRSGIPDNFRNHDFTMIDWELYTDRDGKPYDMGKVKRLLQSFYVTFDQWEKEGLGLYIHSRARGTGKTMLASCICNELNRKYPWSIRFVAESELIPLEKNADETALDRAEQDPIGELCRCKLLVIDDLGATQGGQWLENIMFRIMDERDKNNLVTIITSNVPLSELMLDDRVVDRINKRCVPIKLPDVMIRANESTRTKRDFLQRMGLLEQ